jgi:Fic family protein
MESVLYKNRPQYYQAIEAARKANDSGVFIEFTLSALLEILRHTNSDLLGSEQVTEQVKHQVKHQVKQQVELTETQTAVLEALENKSLSRKEIFAAIGMSVDTRAFKRHIEPLLDAGLVKMTIPDRPNSRNQKYVRA